MFPPKRINSRQLTQFVAINLIAALKNGAFFDSLLRADYYGGIIEVTTTTRVLQEGGDLAENSSENDDQNSKYSSISNVDPPPLNCNYKTGQIPNNIEYLLLNAFNVPTDNM